MNLFVCILKDYRRVEEVLLALLELGISGATLLEGRGMGQILGGEMPLFAGMRGLFPGSAQDSQLILAVISQEMTPECFSVVEHIAGPLDSSGAGIAFSLPLDRVMGLNSPIN